jgi:uncharacterized protein YqhQ
LIVIEGIVELLESCVCGTGKLRIDTDNDDTDTKLNIIDTDKDA